MIVWQTFKTRDNLPVIGWHTYAGTPSASTAAAGFGAALAFNGDTFDAWKPTATPSNISIDFGTAREVTYIGIAAHTIGTDATFVQAEQWTGSAWALIPGCTLAPDNNDPILFLTKPITTSRVRIVITGGIAEVGVFMAGRLTEFEAGRFADYLGPVGNDARVIDYLDNTSVTGEFLGRTVRSDGLEFPFNVDHISETWAATEWPAMRDYFITGKAVAFFANRPLGYPDEVYFARPTELPRLERTLPNKRASRTLSMNLRGYRRL
jgi:hypothetical protein